MSDLFEHHESWLRHLKLRGFSPHTLRAYEGALEEFRKYFAEQQQPRNFEVLAMRAWMDHLASRELAPATIRLKVATVRSFFRYLCVVGAIRVNPARFVRPPKLPPTNMRVVSAHEAHALLDGCGRDQFNQRYPERDLCLLELLYGCGLRSSELLGLNIDDIDLTERWLLVRGKGKKERQLPYGQRVASALERYLAVRPAPANPTDRALFLNPRRTRLGPGGLERTVRCYSQQLLEIRLHPHGLRHAFATHLLSDGMDLLIIQQLLGHANLSATQKYTCVTMSDVLAVYDRAHPKA
jgi:integrase/recombinase XerC